MIFAKLWQSVMKQPVCVDVSILNSCVNLFLLLSSQCSSWCGMGHMTRSVQCSDKIGNVVKDEKCSADIKPVDKIQCRSWK